MMRGEAATTGGAWNNAELIAGTIEAGGSDWGRASTATDVTITGGTTDLLTRFNAKNINQT